MSNMQAEVANSPRKARILDSLKIVVNDLTGINPENIDIHAHFLEAGIDSLTLIQATQLVKEQYDVKLSVVQLLEQLNNMDALAGYIDAALPVEVIAEPAKPEVVLAPAPLPPPPPKETRIKEVPEYRPLPPPQITTDGPGSALDQIMSQQLQVMAQQLEMMRAAYQNGNAAQLPQPEPAPVAPQPEPVVQAPPAPTSFVKTQPAYIPYQPIEPGPTDGLTERQRRHLDELIAKTNLRTRESKRLTQEYRPYLSDSRSTFGFRLLWKEMVYPVIGDRSSGSKVWDVDGNEYVDISMGFGVHLFGHSPDFIDAAFKDQIDRKALQLGPQVLRAGKVAQLLSQLTGLDRANFCNSGTEAVMGALRLARAVTRRSRVAIFSGGYHGWWDGTLAKTQNLKGDQRSVPIAPGISAKACEDLVVLEWDSPASIEYLKQHAHELAAVMVEPVQSRRPDIQPREFLHQLREITNRSSAALIFDEMITGFRIHSGGAQAWFGIQADLATYGKIIGGGLPIGAIAGKAKFMDAFDGGMWNYGDQSYPETEKTIFAGAFFKHPLTMAAGQAILERLRDNPSLLPELNDRTTRLVETLNRYFAEAELPINVVHFSSLFRFVFAPELKYVDLFFYHMLDHGVFIWEGRNCFLSTAHTEDDLRRIVSAVMGSVEQMRAGGFWPEPPGKTNGRPSVTTASEPALAVRNAAEPKARDSLAAPRFSLYYFGNYESEFSEKKYDLLLEGAKYADEHGFEAVWIPERHFHAFGGFSPNPSVVAAALARETHRLQIRAGSLVLPLHNPIRAAEEWSVVDNLSQGRIGISFASGWQPNDFVFAPDAFANRYEHMYRGIELFKQLWRGESVQTRSGNGQEISIRLAPMPMQRQVPLWLTAASAKTFATAGELGLRVLSNLQDQSIEELAEKIAIYHSSLEQHGHDPAIAHVTLLLHTFVAADLNEAREKARQPLYRYMKSSLGLMGNLVKGNKLKPIDLKNLPDEDLEYFLAAGYDRYTQTASLIGTPESCSAIVDRLAEIGVTEIGCMVDFGVDTESVLDSLHTLNTLREQYQSDRRQTAPIVITTETVAVRSIPLTDAQRQLWTTCQIGPDASRAYNEALTHRLRGPFDPQAMRRALEKTIERHETLRSTFTIDGQYQLIHPSLVIDIPLVDFSHVQDSLREAQVEEWLKREIGAPLDFEQGPLVRFRMARLDTDLHLLVLINHHIIVDGQSWRVLLGEIKELYIAERKGVPCELPSPQPFREFVTRQSDLQHRSDFPAAEDYWTTQFAESIPVTELPTDRPRPPVQTYNGARLFIATGEALFTAVKKLCVEQGSTVQMMLLSAYGAFLHLLTGQKQLVIGTPAAGQLSVGGPRIVGFCLNQLPLRSDASDKPSFADYLKSIRAKLLEGYEHQHYSFGQLLRKLDVPWDASRSPIFTTVFLLDRALSAGAFADLEMDFVPSPTDTTRYELRLNVIETDVELLFDCFYNTDLFEEETIKRWMDAYQTLIRNIIDDPQRGLWDLSLLSGDDRRRLLVDWNDTQAIFPKRAGIHELFEDQVRRTPNAAALVCDGRQLSYDDLNRRANRLARFLRRQGVSSEMPVAIYMERSEEILIAVLGVLKAGCAFVPLDAVFGAARQSQILSDCGARIVLTQENLEPLTEGGVRSVYLDREWEMIAAESDEDFDSETSPAQLAYVIYTSGSTGKPKGVGVEHRQLLNYVNSIRERLRLPDSGASFATVSTLAADLGHTMIFPSLVSGGVLHIISRECASDAEALAEYFEREQIDCLKIVPSHLESLLRVARSERNLPRRRLILGGEVTRRGLVDRICELAPLCQVFNHYGPTETTVGVLTYEVKDDSGDATAATLPLGRPIANAQVYVLDGHLQPAPVGMTGELYIGGEGVARGYLNVPDLTAEKFIPDPFSCTPGTRLYRTGDLGRHLPGGNIEFLGRADRQVKVRGYRIEPGEIESTILEIPGVRACIVVVHEDQPDDKRLVAYIVADGKSAPSTVVLREHARRLPQFMQPSAFVVLDELPLTPNGKVDHRRLPAPSNSRGSNGTRVAPRQAIESALIDIWSDVLKLEQVGAHDNFFDLGGHSLLATQICSRIRKVFGVQLTLRSLFEAPTPAGFAKRVLAALRESATDEVIEIPFVRVARGESAPLSFSQQRLWFIDRLEGGRTPFYNISAALRLLGPLDVAALERTLMAVVRRHEMLRTHFIEVEGEPLQVVNDVPVSVLEHEDLSQLPVAELEIAVKRLAAEEAQRPFDLASGPLLRVRLVRISDDDHAIMLTMHHIIGDGWSHSVLIRDVAVLYNSFADGGDGQGVLAELPLQYADFAIWQRQWLSGAALEKQLDYWRRQLHGAPRLLELPTDRKRPDKQTYRGGTVTRLLPNPLSTSLKELTRQEGVTMFMTLLAAFQALLHRYSGQDDIAVGSPIANRNHSEIENIVGFFVNTLVFRTTLYDDPGFDALLKRVRETALGAYAHQDLPFELLVEQLQPERSLGHTPLFQVLFTWNSATRESFELKDLTLQAINTASKSAKFDLTLSTFDSEKGIGAVFDYNTDLFDEHSIQRMAEHFEMLLESIIANPRRRLSEHSFLTAAEKQQLLASWNDTSVDYESPRLLHQLVAAQVARTPNHVAVVFGNEQLTYVELDRRASLLANELRRRGVGPDERVGVCMNRSVELVVALLGVLQAGGAYVPLDPGYPNERLLFMLEDSQPAVLLTQRSLLDELPPYQAAATICLDQWRWKESPIEESLTEDVTAANLVSVIYTSGSTGKPKGVMNAHEGIVNRLRWGQQRYGLTPADVVLQKTPFSFDVSAWEFFWPLMTGAKLVLARPGGHQDPSYLAELIEHEQVTTIHFVPSMLQSFLGFAELKRCASLKRVFSSGEMLSAELQDRFHSLIEAELHNLYGPTEASVEVTHWTCRRDDGNGLVPIGRPIANTEMYILDAAAQPVPHGLAGELHIGGVGLARGYLNKPDLTAERFVPHRFSDKPGARLYRTGDRARYRADGQIEYLGRMDHQVKLRGFRIELAEIEATLAEHPAISECAVIARETLPGEMGLVAYVVHQDEAEPGDEELRRHLKQSLPDYMVPAVFVRLTEMPLSPSGKLDRRALPAPGTRRQVAAEFIAPRTALESQLAQIWEDLLNVRPISINQSFFELGGHSLLAVRLIARIHQQIGLDLPISVLFQGETIEKLAVLIAKQEDGAVRWSPLVPIQPRGSRLPFFCVHAVGGNVNNFYELAREMGTGQPFFGLQAPQLHEVEEEETTIERIAARYLEAVVPVVGDGPYLLGGYSFGSYVAYEMARQLEEQHKRVGLLVVVDSYSPLYLNQLTDTHSVADLLISLAWVTAREKGKQLMLSADDLRPLEFDDQLSFFLDKMNEADLVPPELDYKLVRRFVKGFAVRRTAAYTYTPPRYGGRVTLLKCEQIDALMTQRMMSVGLDSNEPAFGWRDLCDDVEVHTVAGHHDVICNQPYVKGLAARITECLERAALKELTAKA